MQPKFNKGHKIVLVNGVPHYKFSGLTKEQAEAAVEDLKKSASKKYQKNQKK